MLKNRIDGGISRLYCDRVGAGAVGFLMRLCGPKLLVKKWNYWDGSAEIEVLTESDGRITSLRSAKRNFSLFV
jgi:hypothetical protein